MIKRFHNQSLSHLLSYTVPPPDHSLSHTLENSHTKVERSINGALVKTSSHLLACDLLVPLLSSIIIFLLLCFRLKHNTMAAAPSLNLLLIILSLLLVSLPRSESLPENPSLILLGDGFDWPIPDGGIGGGESFEDAEEEEDNVGVVDRRSLYWHRKRYYISYGALSANRVPCPPRSGRSYYTHNCFRARGPVHPYSRGCSSITRCRR